MVGGVLLRTPASFSFCNRPGGASRVALIGLKFDVWPGGAVRAAPAGLPGVVSLSGCLSSALADVVSILLCSSLLGRLGPSSHGLPQLRSLCHEVHDRQGLQRRVRRTACPSLEGLSGGELDRIFGNDPRGWRSGNKSRGQRDREIDQTGN